MRALYVIGFLAWSACLLGPLVWMNLVDDDDLRERQRRLDLAGDWRFSQIALTLVAGGAVMIATMP